MILLSLRRSILRNMGEIMNESDSIIRKVDSKFGDMIFAGALADELAKYHLKGRTRLDVVRYYSEVYKISQKQLNTMIKDRE